MYVGPFAPIIRPIISPAASHLQWETTARLNSEIELSLVSRQQVFWQALYRAGSVMHGTTPCDSSDDNSVQ